MMNAPPVHLTPAKRLMLTRERGHLLRLGWRTAAVTARLAELDRVLAREA
jgi:hypothetical protein